MCACMFAHHVLDEETSPTFRGFYHKSLGAQNIFVEQLLERKKLALNMR